MFVCVFVCVCVCVCANSKGSKEILHIMFEVHLKVLELPDQKKKKRAKLNISSVDVCQIFSLKSQKATLLVHNQTCRYIIQKSGVLIKILF